MCTHKCIHYIFYNPAFFRTHLGGGCAGVQGPGGGRGGALLQRAPARSSGLGEEFCRLGLQPRAGAGRQAGHQASKEGASRHPGRSDVPQRRRSRARARLRIAVGNRRGFGRNLVIYSRCASQLDLVDGGPEGGGDGQRGPTQDALRLGKVLDAIRGHQSQNGAQRQSVALGLTKGHARGAQEGVRQHLGRQPKARLARQRLRGVASCLLQLRHRRAWRDGVGFVAV